jgi:ligand-binding sensor domain-containing protein
LSDDIILALAEDRDGNLWIGSEGGGVCKLAGELIVCITKTEGLPGQSVTQVIEDRQGRIYASVRNGGLVAISAERAVPIPRSQSPTFRTNYFFQDGRGVWWIGASNGAWFRFQETELQMHRGAELSPALGISATSIKAGVFLRGQAEKLWAISRDGILYRMDLARKDHSVFERLPVSLIPPFDHSLLLTNDRSGELWLGVHDSGIGRIVNDKIEVLQPTEGLPETNPRAFFLDSRGWLWIGLRYKGVSVTKDPSAATPKFVNYSTTDGLVSDTVWSIAEDDFGRMYLGTGKGLDQLDPATGRIHHFNTKDGLASDLINSCLKDRSGNI